MVEEVSIVVEQQRRNSLLHRNETKEPETEPEIEEEASNQKVELGSSVAVAVPNTRESRAAIDAVAPIKEPPSSLLNRRLSKEKKARGGPVKER